MWKGNFMNLKEAFRYQKFLDSMMIEASASVTRRDHCLKTKKIHHYNSVNPDVQDKEEVVETDFFYANDDVLNFMRWMIEERYNLSHAISVAKSTIKFDIDAEIETNKFRQKTYNSIKSMTKYQPNKRIEQGRDYKFNVEGNQTPYFYEVETTTERAYNEEAAKRLMKAIIATSDEVSSSIDVAMTTTEVDYTPIFDVNDDFNEAMVEFLEKSDEMGRIVNRSL